MGLKVLQAHVNVITDSHFVYFLSDEDERIQFKLGELFGTRLKCDERNYPEGDPDMETFWPV